MTGFIRSTAFHRRPARGTLLAVAALATALLTAACEQRDGVGSAMLGERSGGGTPAPTALTAESSAGPTAQANAATAGKQAPDTVAAAQAKAPRPAEPTRTPVEVVVLRRQAFGRTATYIGHLLPAERVTLRAELEGVAERVAVTEGQAVGEGEVLVHIATEQLRVRRELAQTNLKLAETTYHRNLNLNRRKLIPDAKLDESRAQRDQARFNLRLAEIELQKSQVVSPLTGVVKSTGVERGEYVNKGQFIAEVLDVGQLRALINVPEREVRFLVVGHTVAVSAEALPGRSFPGTITLVGLEADTASRTFAVEVTLDNADQQLRPGMLARVEAVLEHFPSALLIPRHAVLEREQGRIVFVAKGGVAVERTVETGASPGNQVQVLRGLKAGERLVVRGQHKLAPGEPIAVRKARR